MEDPIFLFLVISGRVGEEAAQLDRMFARYAKWYPQWHPKTTPDPLKLWRYLSKWSNKVGLGFVITFSPSILLTNRNNNAHLSECFPKPSRRLFLETFRSYLWSFWKECFIYCLNIKLQLYTNDLNVKSEEIFVMENCLLFILKAW